MAEIGEQAVPVRREFLEPAQPMLEPPGLSVSKPSHGHFPEAALQAASSDPARALAAALPESKASLAE